MMYHGNFKNILIITILFVLSILSVFNENKLLTYKIFAGIGLLLLLLSLIFIIAPQKKSYFMICLFLSGLFSLISAIIWSLNNKIHPELYLSFLSSILCIIFSLLIHFDIVKE